MRWKWETIVAKSHIWFLHRGHILTIFNCFKDTFYWIDQKDPPSFQDRQTLIRYRQDKCFWNTDTGVNSPGSWTDNFDKWYCAWFPNLNFLSINVCTGGIILKLEFPRAQRKLVMMKVSTPPEEKWSKFTKMINTIGKIKFCILNSGPSLIRLCCLKVF